MSVRDYPRGVTQRSWLRAALIVGLTYFVVGRLFAVPTTHVQFWRLAAWAVSGMAYAAHIAYEHFGLRNPARSLAVHAAVAAAIGAFALALAGFLHAVQIPSPRLWLWPIALIAWPIVTGVPAFIVAFVIGVVLQRMAPARNEQ